jgi:ADP-heptose:LPS heptosyltransferase
VATYAVSLQGGIGGVVDAMPFMWHLKAAGEVVIARSEGCSREECELARDVYDELVDGRWHVVGAVDNGCPRRGALSRRHDKPEWEAWFELYGLPVPPAEMAKTDTYWEDVPYRHDVVLAPTVRPDWPMKSWPHWGELARLMPGCAVVGLPGDGGEFGPECADLRGKLTLAQVAGLFKMARCVVAQDGGLARLSAANGTRTCILFGGTSWYKNFPPRNGVLVTLERLMPCQPCQFEGCYVEWMPAATWHGCKKEQKVDGRWSRCLHALTPETVMDAVAERKDAR